MPNIDFPLAWESTGIVERENNVSIYGYGLTRYSQDVSDDKEEEEDFMMTSKRGKCGR